MNSGNPQAAIWSDMDGPAACVEAQAARQLWAQVLLLAVLDVQGRGYAATASTRGGLRERAAAWLASDGGGIGSFAWCCLLLDLDAAQVRRAVLPKTNTKNARPRPKR